MAAYGYGAPQVPADPTAVIGRRIGAFFIDAAIAIAVMVLCFFPFATKRTVSETLALPDCHPTFDRNDEVRCDNRVVFTVGDDVYEANVGTTLGLSFAFSFLYYGIFQGLTGATVGKFLTGIRVVDQSGAIANVGRSLLRWIVFLVDGPFSGYLCGLLTFLLTKGHRRLGDMAASTYVVGTTAVGQPVIIPTAGPQYAPGPHYAGVSSYPPPAASPGAPVTAPGAPAPQWDPVRNAYVQWDPATGRYLTWNQTTQTWQ